MTHKLVFLALILLLPTQLALHFWPSWSLIFGIRVDYLSPTLYVTDLLVILLFLFSKKSNLLPRLFWPFLLILIFLVVNSISALTPLLAAYKWLKIFEFAFLAVYVNHYYSWVKKALFLPLFISLVFTSILSLLQVANTASLGGIFYFLGERYFTLLSPGISTSQIGGQIFLRPYATLPHPNALAGFLLVGFLLLIFTKASKKLLLLALLLFLPTFILAGSKSAILAAVLLIFIHFLAIRWLRLISKLMLITTVLVSLISPLLFTNLSRNLENFPFWASSRIALSVVSLEIASASPQGVGLGNFILHSHNKLPSTLSSIRFQPVHNATLLLFTELGVLLFSASVVFLFLLLRSTNKFALMCLFAIIITSLFDHYWVTLEQPFLLAALVVGLISHAKIRK